MGIGENEFDPVDWLDEYSIAMVCGNTDIVSTLGNVGSSVANIDSTDACLSYEWVVSYET